MTFLVPEYNPAHVFAPSYAANGDRTSEKLDVPDAHLDEPECALLHFDTLLLPVQAVTDPKLPACLRSRCCSPAVGGVSLRKRKLRNFSGLVSPAAWRCTMRY